MSNIIIAPAKYVQGKGELKKLGSYTQKLGSKPFIIASESGLKRVKSQICEGYSEEPRFEVFRGECSRKEIDRIISELDGCDMIVGIGGGKILDTAKAVAYYAKLPVVIVPTIASTDAPCSALSVIYTDEGVFEEYLFLPQNPDLVLLDTDIVAAAPVRLIVSGMGDALATWFEARAAKASDSNNCAGGRATNAGMALAELCYKTLIADGYRAKLAAERGVCTKAVENVIEANTFLSGVGFESGGLAAAHAIHNGLTTIADCHRFYHGEKVAFGTLVQLVMENVPEREFNEVMNFCLSVGLPVCLEDIGITELHKFDLKKAAEAACAPTDTMKGMPFEVTPEMVYDAIIGADALGRTSKKAFRMKTAD